SSEVKTSTPRISRCPSALTPVAITVTTFTTRPPSRQRWVSASTHRYVYGPSSSGRLRKSSTMPSRLLASSETWDFEIRSTTLALRAPPAAVALHHRLPASGRDPGQVARAPPRHHRPLGASSRLQQPLRVVAALAQLGDGQADRAHPGVPVSLPVAVTGVDAL